MSNCLDNYWSIERNEVLNFEEQLLNLADENNLTEVLEQMQSYLLNLMSKNFENKLLFNRFMRDLEYIETAKRQANLTPPMYDTTICENLAFKMILG